MNRLLLFIFLSIAASCNSQGPSSNTASGRGEFATQNNGLMYSDADIKVLRYIVDSLNLRFKTCELNKTYFSCPQRKLTKVKFGSNTDNLRSIVESVKKNPSLAGLLTQYKEFVTSIDSSDLLIKMQGEKDKEYTLYGNPYSGYNDSYGNYDDEGGTAGNWEYALSKNKSPDEKRGRYRFELTCRFFADDWKQPVIPEKYGRLLQYVDCMVDTNAVIFLTEDYDWTYYPGNEKEKNSPLAPLVKYVCERYKGACNPEAPGLTELQLSFAATHLTNDPTFRKMTMQAVDTVIASKKPNYYLEQLTDSLKMYDKSLLLKRSRRVMGQCSMDDSPRLHALDIARTAARAHSWDIFLRSHLDIMNDRFERMTDGSYAWERRKTYLMELEALNLNVVDLMLGLTMRASNLSENHYYGTIWRVGWALAESREKERFEKTALDMLKDASLDEFNRGLVFLLYNTYCSYLPVADQKAKRNALSKTIGEYPGFIQHSFKQLKEPTEKKR